MLQKKRVQESNNTKISWGFFCYGLFILILIYQAINPNMDFLGPRFIGAFFEPLLISIFFLALGGMTGLILAAPLCGIYYLLLLQVILLITRSRWWVVILLLFPLIILVCAREFNIEYKIAYYHTYRDMTSNETCKNTTNAFRAYVCQAVVKRNVYQKSHVEYCRTLRRDYSACIQEVALFTKDLATCSLLNQDIALRYTGSSTSPYLRDCVKNFVKKEHLTLEQACPLFSVERDYDDCIDVFVDQTKNWSLCDRMKEHSAIKRCKYYRDEYLRAQKNW